MPIPAPPSDANSISVKSGDIIKAAMQEIGALSPGEQPSLDDSAWVLQKLQRLIDRYNAMRPMVYSDTFTQFTLQVNHQPHTIGPGADFDVIQRPIDIPTIGLILVGSTTPVEVPLQRRDKDWWAAQTIKSLSSTLPTDYYYSPDWPNGSINFWPVPTAVNDVLIQSRSVLAQIDNYNQTFSMPPAYWDAVVYPLAVSLCPSFERQASPDLQALASQSIRAVEGNNISSPRLFSDSPSQSGTNRSRPDFNFLTGLNR